MLDNRRIMTSVTLFLLTVTTFFLPSCTNTPSQSQSTDTQSPTITPVSSNQLQSRNAEIVAKVTQVPGNITVTPDRRILITLHQFAEPKIRVAEVRNNGQELIPFPNTEWAQGRHSDGTGFDAPLGIQSDPDGIVWILDNGTRTNVTPQIVGWNTRTNQLERLIPLPQPVTEKASFVNDLAVDRTNQAIYITDTAFEGTPALIVVNLQDGKARRVLPGHKSVIAEDIDLVVEGKPVRTRRSDGTIIKPRYAANPIALSYNNEWLYYGPMNGSRLYRVRTTDLLNPELSSEQLAQRVEDYAAKPNCDGISTDQQGNVYITDLATNTIGVIRPDRTYQPLVSQPWMTWLDAFSFGPDGYLYSVVNQLHRTAALNGGENLAKPPYLIIRVQPLAQGLVGR